MTTSCTATLSFPSSLFPVISSATRCLTSPPAVPVDGVQSRQSLKPIRRSYGSRWLDGGLPAKVKKPSC
ncbi:hypothetical protein QVD17_30520 [Tagetes erecta]|uniref:Uncharacterized protein n=1 Tax=Tagetes erecta TaxID=13708 RepID=A0AAD8K2T2_TARER|nr:hypothetical protein QVD17_30520 [Tagetes erecta]